MACVLLHLQKAELLSVLTQRPLASRNPGLKLDATGVYRPSTMLLNEQKQC